MPQSEPVPGAEANHLWSKFAQTAQTGRHIIITLSDSTVLKGRLSAIDMDTIYIELPGGVRACPAPDVLCVRYAGVRKRHVLYGALLGMAGGSIMTMIIDRQSAHPSTAAEAAGLGAFFVGLPVGAAVGALMPVGPPLYVRP